MDVKQPQLQICKQKHREGKKAIFTILQQLLAEMSNISSVRGKISLENCTSRLYPIWVHCPLKRKLEYLSRIIRWWWNLTWNQQHEMFISSQIGYIICTIVEGWNFSEWFRFHADPERPKTVPISKETGRDTGTWKT